MNDLSVVRQHQIEFEQLTSTIEVVIKHKIPSHRIPIIHTPSLTQSHSQTHHNLQIPLQFIPIPTLYLASYPIPYSTNRAGHPPHAAAPPLPFLPPNRRQCGKLRTRTTKSKNQTPSNAKDRQECQQRSIYANAMLIVHDCPVVVVVVVASKNGETKKK